MAERLELEIAVDEALRRLRRIDDALAKNERTVRQTSASYEGMGRTLRTVYQVVAVGVVAQASRELFRLGTAAEETGSRYRTVMGPAVEEANAFLDEFAVQAGLSRVAAEGLTATTAAIAQGMGFAQDASAGFAEDVVRLSADLSSFNNLPTEDVLRSINAAVTGERESLKRLGIVINETEVQQRALNDTGKQSAATLTAQEKATATLALITEKAGVAVGDLSRTQDSAANTARRVQARMADLKNEVATAVLPIFAELIGAVDDSAGAFDFLGDAISGFGRFVRTGIAEVQILGTRLAVLGAALDVVQNAFATKANKRPFAEAIEDFRQMQDAAAETREEILQSLNAAVTQSQATERTARAQVQLTTAAAATAKEMQEAAKAEAERLAAVVELVALRAEEGEELQQVFSRLEEINRLQRDGIADARTRLDLLKEEQRIRDAIISRIGAPSGGIATEGPTAGRSFSGGSEALAVNRAGIDRATAALNELDAQASDTAKSILAGAEGFVALANSLGVLPEGAANAARAVTDIARGVQNLRDSASQGLGSLAALGGATGIAAGVFSFVRSVTSASTQAQVAIEEAAAQLDRTILGLANPLDRVGQTLLRYAELFQQLDPGSLSADFVRAGAGFQATIRNLTNELGALTGDELVQGQRIVQALVGEFNRLRDSFSEELELRRVAAEFGDEAADRLRIQIELEKALAEARRLGIDEAIVREVFAAEERRRLRNEQAAAEEEYARQQRESARAAEEAAQAQQEAQRIQEEIAARIEEGNQSLADEIALRGLLLDGKDEEADLLRQEIRFRKELADAIEAGLDPQLIEDLKDIQRRERERAQDGNAAEELISSTQRDRGGSAGAAEVRASVFSASVYADTLTDLTRSSNNYLREIAEGVRGGGFGGGTRVQITQNFNGPITADLSGRGTVNPALLDAINRGLGSQQQDDALLTSGGVLR